MSTYTLEILASTPEIRSYYTQRANFSTDAGVDLYIPETTSILPYETKLVDLGVRCRMLNADGEEVSYILVPRSSIVKTPLLLHNSIGIIDVGYRNTIKAALRHCPSLNTVIRLQEDYVAECAYEIEKDTRLVQLVAPGFGKIRVILVNELPTSERGEGGFGSTGSTN
jgi:dUTP pyrophosphatase